MVKGHKGESCHDAIRAIMTKEKKPYRYSDLKTMLQSRGNWKDATIRRMIMSAVVNLPPAREEWSSTPFIFLRQDGRFEIYEKHIHGKVLD